MRFDKDKAMIKCLEKIKAIFSDPKAMDSAVYRSRVLQKAGQGAIALSTSEIMKAWSPQGALDQDIVDVQQLEFVWSQEDAFASKLHDIIRAKAQTPRQGLILYAAILTAYQSVEDLISKRQSHWQAIITTCAHAKSKDKAAEKLAEYAKDSLADLSFDLGAAVLTWAAGLEEPAFESDDADVLSSSCYEYVKASVLEPDQQYQTTEREAYLSREVFLLDMLKENADVVCVFGSTSKQLFPLSLREKIVFGKPFDALDCRVTPRAHVGRIVSYDVYFEGHGFVLHDSAVDKSHLTEEESAYFLAQQEACVKQSKHFMQINGRGDFYQPEEKKAITVNTSARLLLYDTAIKDVLQKLESTYQKLGESALQEDISTLGIVQSKLAQYDRRRLNKLKGCDHIPDALKRGAEDEMYALLSYLVETLDTSLLKQNTLLISYLLDLSLLTQEESNSLQMKWAEKTGEESFDSVAPLFLKAAIEHYDQSPIQTGSESKADEQLVAWIVSYARGSEAWICKLLLEDRIDEARDVLHMLTSLIQQHSGIFAALIKERTTSFFVLHRVLEIDEHVNRNDFVRLLQLEHKLIQKWDDEEEKDGPELDLTDEEHRLLLDYDHYFEGLENGSQETQEDKRAYLSRQMKKARGDYLTRASSAPDQATIQGLNIETLLGVMAEFKHLSIADFIQARKETKVLSIEKVPHTHMQPKSCLIVKIDDFSIEQLSLLTELIENANQKGVHTVKFVSANPMEALIKQIVLPDSMISARFVNREIELAWLNAKSGIAADNYLIVHCEAKQDPVNALLVASYALGGFNQAIRFFNGEDESLDYDKLPGFKQYGLKHTPLLGLYRPKWLDERIDSTLKPPVTLEIQEEHFFKAKVLPFLPVGILRRSYENLAPFYQQYVKFVFYQQCSSIMASSSSQDKTYLVHAVMSLIMDNIAGYKKLHARVEACREHIHETGLLDYAYYASSKSAKHGRFARHLAAMREELSLPVSDSLSRLAEHFKTILSCPKYDASQLLVLERMIEEAIAFSDDYQTHIKQAPDDLNYALIRYLSRIKAKMRGNEIWQSIAQTPWYDLPESWQIDIVNILKKRLTTSRDITERKSLLIDAVTLLKNKLTHSNKKVFDEVMEIYAHLKAEIKSTSLAENKRFFCNLLYDYMVSSTLFSDEPESNQSLVEAGYFTSFEAYTQWATSEKQDLITLMSNMPVGMVNEPNENAFLQNILQLLTDDDLDEALKLKLSERLCQKIAVSSAALEDEEKLLACVSECLQSPMLPDSVRQKISDALYTNIQTCKNSLVFPKVLSELHWREKIDSVFFSLTHIYSLIKRYETAAGKELMEGIREEMLQTAHAYFNAQLDKIDTLHNRQFTAAEIDALKKRLGILDEFACFFEQCEGVSFLRLKALHLSERLQDQLPSDRLLSRREVKPRMLSQGYLSPKLIHRYLLRQHNLLPIVAIPSEVGISILESMYDLLLEEGDQVFKLSAADTQLKSLPDLFDHIVQMTSIAGLESFETQNLSTLFQIKQLLTKLYNFSFETGVNDIIAQKSDGKLIDTDLINAQVKLVDQHHAKLFLTALKCYIEQQACTGAWQTGIQLNKTVITIEDTVYPVPRRVAGQYELISTALAEGEKQGAAFDYVTIEKTVLDEGKTQYNRHGFWSGDASKCYWDAFHLPHGKRYDFELQVTDRLQLSGPTSA